MAVIINRLQPVAQWRSARLKQRQRNGIQQRVAIFSPARINAAILRNLTSTIIANIYKRNNVGQQ